jgi:electron transfer flavoprotein alpha subunit
MPPAPDLEGSFQFLQRVAADAFSRHRVSAWLCGTGKTAAEGLHWQGKEGALFCRAANVQASGAGEYLSWVRQMYLAEKPDLLLFYGNILGQSLAAMFAQSIGSSCFMQATQVAFGQVLFVYKNACSSNVVWGREIARYPYVVSVVAEKAPLSGQKTPVQPVARLFASTLSAPVCHSELLEGAAQNPLEQAKTVFIGGRGLGGAENAQKLRALAQAFGAAVGLSRPAAMNGWGDMRETVGQSGTRIAPELCVAFGVSGSAAFLAGVRRAKTLVAVNTDRNAPIFRHADEGLVADTGEVLDCWLKKCEVS